MVTGQVRLVFSHLAWQRRCHLCRSKRALSASASSISNHNICLATSSIVSLV